MHKTTICGSLQHYQNNETVAGKAVESVLKFQATGPAPGIYIFISGSRIIWSKKSEKTLYYLYKSIGPQIISVEPKPILWLRINHLKVFVSGSVFSPQNSFGSGPSPGFSSRGGKKTEGGHIFKIMYFGCMQQPGGQIWNGGHRFQMGCRAPVSPPPLATALLRIRLNSPGLMQG